MTVRVLTVMVDGWLIEDGSVRPPAVGEPLAICLEFIRRAEPGTDSRIGSIRAVAHPTLDREPLRHPDGHLQWETVLRGDGWSAAWRADRPVVGQIAENGSFLVDHAGRTEPVRGLVTRVRNVFGTLVYGNQGWVHSTADTLDELEDIETSPRWFDNVPGDRDPEPGDTRRHHMGVVIDLDLDNVPPAPVRSRVVPSAVSAAGSTLWLLDGELPVLVRVVDPIGAATATEYVLPAGVVNALADPRPRRVFADESGCWVAGRSDVLRCNVIDDEMCVDRFDLGPVRFATARQGSLLVVTENQVVIISSSGEQQNVSTPSGGLRPVIDCAPTETGFLLLTMGLSRRPVEVFEIDEFGSFQQVSEVEARALFVIETDCGLRVFTYRGVIDGRSGETLLAQSFLSGGQLDDRVWVVRHRPDGTGKHGWWPVEDGDQLPPREDGQWLFVALNPVTFAVLSVRPIKTSRPDVTVDEEGRIWIAGLGVRGIERGGRTVELDVASLLS